LPFEPFTLGGQFGGQLFGGQFLGGHVSVSHVFEGYDVLQSSSIGTQYGKQLCGIELVA
jgi:hypothetical protein